MKVKDLIKALSKQDPNRVVILSSDPEGNSYDALHSLSTCAYTKEDGEIQIGLEELSPQDLKLGYTEDDVLYRGKPALILSP